MTDNIKLFTKDPMLRVDRIIHFGIHAAYNGFSHAGNNAFEFSWIPVWKAIGISPPSSRRPQAIVEYLQSNNISGFLIEFGTPTPTSLADHGYNHQWWDYYTELWVYGDTMDMACEKAIALKDSYIEVECKRLNINR